MALVSTCTLFNSFEIILLPQPCPKGESGGYPLGSPWRWAAVSGKRGTCHDVVTLRLFLKLLQIQSHTISMCPKYFMVFDPVPYPNFKTTLVWRKSGQPCCTGLITSWLLGADKRRDFLGFPLSSVFLCHPGNWIMSRPEEHCLL